MTPSQLRWLYSAIIATGSTLILAATNTPGWHLPVLIFAAVCSVVTVATVIAPENDTITYRPGPPR